MGHGYFAVLVDVPILVFDRVSILGENVEDHVHAFTRLVHDLVGAGVDALDGGLFGRGVAGHAPVLPVEHRHVTPLPLVTLCVGGFDGDAHASVAIGLVGHDVERR